MRVVCINDKNKPNEIPQNLWIKEKEIYEVKKVSRDKYGNYMLTLVKPRLTKECWPYHRGYNANRFAVVNPDLEDEADNVLKKMLEEHDVGYVKGRV
jgi:hypothetical protein